MSGCIFEWLNNLHRKFDISYHHRAIPFLEPEVYKDHQGCLAVRTFHKISDWNSYLHFQRFHPQFLKTNLPYGQFLDAKCNSYQLTDFKKEADKIENQFLARGYPL